MSTLKRKNDNGVWEYLQLTGQDVSGLTTQLADRATKKQSTNWINVAEYVDITGVSDCGTIVNSLIAGYTSTDNIVLYFPKGTYNFINNLILKSNMTICGEGTLLLNKAWGIYGVNITNVCIKDVTIQGIVTDYHVYFKDSNHITIKNVKKYSTSYGFSFMFLHCDYVLVDGNFIKSSSTQVYDDGIHFVGNHIKVINNYVETYDDCVSFGLVNLAESNTVYKDIYIAGNTLISNASRSVMHYYNNSGYSVKDIIIKNNNCKGPIKFRHDDALNNIVFFNITISNNNVENTLSTHGIDVGAAQYVLIQGNIVKFDTSQGINFSHDVSDIDIVDNTVVYIGAEKTSGSLSVFSYCINMGTATSVQSINIFNNRLLHTYSRGISPKGNNIKIANNTFKPTVGATNSLFSIYDTTGNISFMVVENNRIISTGTVNQHMFFTNTFTYSNVYVNNNYYNASVSPTFIGGTAPTTATNNVVV